MSSVLALSKLQQSGHVGASRTVKRLPGNAGDFRRLSLEGGDLVGDLEQELLLVAFEVDPVGNSQDQHGTVHDFGLRAEFRDGERLGDVRQRVLSLTTQSDCGRSSEHGNSNGEHLAHQALSSFDFDVHHAADRMLEQAAASRSPYDWSLDEPGKAFHVGPMTTVIPPDLDPHVSPRVIPLAASRQSRMEVLRSTMLAYAAIGFIFAIGAAAFYGAAIRLPEVRQASIDVEGV